MDPDGVSCLGICKEFASDRDLPSIVFLLDLLNAAGQGLAVRQIGKILFGAFYDGTRGNGLDFGSIFDLYPLDASSTSPPAKQ